MLGDRESHYKVVGEVKDTKPKSSLLGTKRLHTLLPALQSWFKRWKALIFKGCRRNASRALATSHTVLYVPPRCLQMPIVSNEGRCIEFIFARMPAASQSPTKLLRTACLSSEINHMELGNKSATRVCGESAKSIFHRFQTS